MNIGDAALRAGLPVKTIRYYEEVGLVKPARAGNGYRDYAEEDVHRLGFVNRARSLGFSIAECRQLLSLYEDTGRASHDVKDVATGHIARIEAKIAELEAMKATLARLAAACHGDERPECPILDDIAGGFEGACH
jgi:MerR family transcriptional regulator, copper efflux regulator